MILLTLLLFFKNLKFAKSRDQLKFNCQYFLFISTQFSLQIYKRMIGNKLGSIMMRNARPMFRPCAAQGAKRNLNVHEYVSMREYIII